MMTNNKLHGTVNNITYTFKGIFLFSYVYALSNGHFIREVNIPFYKRNEFLSNPDKYFYR